MYVKWDLDFLGIMVPRFGILVTQGPDELLDDHLKTKLTGVIGWNLVELANKVFETKFGSQVFEDFDCLTGISPLLFSQLCTFHNKVGAIQLDSNICKDN